MNSNFIDRNNNFDFLRLVLASLVIFSHSYPLTGNTEILMFNTKGQLDFGSLAVDCFFILSGYFIFESLKRSKTWSGYFWKRLLRLYPALIVLMVFTLLLFPFLYSGNHLTSTIKGYWQYAIGCLSLYGVKFKIPGVFENNPYPNSINGSLWSLSYEFTMYTVLSLLFFVRKKIICCIILGSFCAILYYVKIYENTLLNDYFNMIHLRSSEFYRLAYCFLAGSFLTFFDLQKFNTLAVRIILSLTIFFSLLFNIYQYVSPFVLPVLILMIGLLSTKPINTLSRNVGDISYGVYIYGFIIQQSLMNFFSLTPLYLTLLSIPITYILAFLSWRYIEERMLQYKNLVR